MPKEIITLQDNEWVQLKKMVYPEKDIGGYVFSHEKRCRGQIVSLLPYKREIIKLDLDKATYKILYLLRKEVTPCWSPYQKCISSITGGVESSIIKTAVQELEEEAGYKVKEEDLIPLGSSFGTKSSDTIYTYYSVDLSIVEKTGKGEGDGSELERKAHCFWSEHIDDAVDPLVYVMYYRLQKYLKEKK